MSEALQTMIGTLEALLVFFLLFPGFFVEAILERTQPYQRKDTLQKLTNVAFFTFVLYGVYKAAHRLLQAVPLFQLPESPFEVINQTPYLEIHIGPLVFVLLSAALLGLFIVPWFNRYAFPLLNKWGIIEVTGDIDAWDRTGRLLEECPTLVEAKLKDGTCIQGRALYISTAPTPPQIILSYTQKHPLQIQPPHDSAPRSLKHGIAVLPDPQGFEWLLMLDGSRKRRIDGKAEGDYSEFMEEKKERPPEDEELVKKGLKPLPDPDEYEPESDGQQDEGLQ